MWERMNELIKAQEKGEITSDIIGDSRETLCQWISAEFINHDINDENLVQLLKAIRILVCTRDKSAELFWTQECLAKYLECASKKWNEDIGTEAVKCLNNCLYQNDKAISIVWKNTTLIDSLSTIIERGGHLENLAKIFIVSLYIFSSKQENISASSVENLTIKLVNQLVSLYLALETDNDGVPILSGTPVAKSTRDAIDKGMRVVYSIGHNYQLVLQNLVMQSKQYASTLTEDELNHIAGTMDLSPKIPVLDRLGFLSVRIFTNPYLKDPKNDDFFASRSSALNILMIACDKVDEFVDFLYVHRVMDTMYNFLEDQYHAIVNDHTESGTQPQKTFIDLYSVLMTLNIACQRSVLVREHMKSLIFPRELPDIDPSSFDDPAAAEVAMKQRQMDGNTPNDVFGHELIKLMLCLDGNLKRFVGELMYTLCNEDATEFVTRCGYGHAVHLLAIKSGKIHDIMAEQEKQQQQHD